MVSPAIGHALHELVPEARMVWVERSSHFAQVDTPDDGVRTLLDFLAQPGVFNSPVVGDF